MGLLTEGIKFLEFMAFAHYFMMWVFMKIWRG
jgi:hypothetical protein